MPAVNFIYFSRGGSPRISTAWHERLCTFRLSWSSSVLKGEKLTKKRSTTVFADCRTPRHYIWKASFTCACTIPSTTPSTLTGWFCVHHRQNSGPLKQECGIVKRLRKSSAPDPDYPHDQLKKVQDEYEKVVRELDAK